MSLQHLAAPCAECEHPFRKHDRLQQLNGDKIPRYRCTVKDCYCGQQYEPIIARLPPGASEADVEAEMLRLGAEHDRRVEAAKLRRLGRSFLR